MLNLAVIGCGRMASELAERSIQLGRANIAAIYDPNPEALALACQKFDAKPVPNLEDLATDAGVDAFLVGSPPLYHRDNVMAVAPSGKPIYCEKPLCTATAFCDAMIETCRLYRAKLFVGQVLRLFPLFWKSHEIIASGAIGTPQLCSITRAGRGAFFGEGWRTNFAVSGGLLLEVNSHEFDYMLSLLGEAESVFAQGQNLNGFGDYDDALVVQVRFKNGGIGVLHTSNSSPIGEYRVHIQATNGNMVHGGFGGELRYRAFPDEQATVIAASELSDLPNGYDRELLSFFDWAEHDTPPLFTGETGRANVAVAEAAYLSLRSGKPEPVPG
jgi:predicted dehydrogenase